MKMAGLVGIGGEGWGGDVKENGQARGGGDRWGKGVELGNRATHVCSLVRQATPFHSLIFIQSDDSGIM